VADPIAGKGVEYPTVGHRTFKQAPKAGVKDRDGSGQDETLLRESN